MNSSAKRVMNTDTASNMWKAAIFLFVFLAAPIGLTACSDGASPTAPELDPEPDATEIEVTLEGTVTGEDAEAVEDAEVAVFRISADERLGQAITGEDGAFSISFKVLENERPDKLRLTAEADGFTFYEESIDFEGQIRQDIALEAVAIVYSVSDQGGLHAISSDKGQSLWMTENVPERVSALSVSPSGDVYVGGGVGEANLVKIAYNSGDEIWSYTADSAWLRDIFVDDDDNVYLAISNEIHEIDGISGSLVSVRNIRDITGGDGFSPSSILVDSDNNIYVSGRIHFSSIGSFPRITKIPSDKDEEEWFYFHDDWVNQISLTKDGYVVSVSDDQEVHKIDIESGERDLRYTGHSSGVKSSAIGTDGSIVSASVDVHSFDSSTGSNIWVYQDHRDFVNAIAVNERCGNIFTASADGEVHKLSHETGERLWRYEDHSGPVVDIAISK